MLSIHTYKPKQQTRYLKLHPAPRGRVPREGLLKQQTDKLHLPMGPARMTLRLPRRMPSSWTRSSALSRSRRVAASASRCRCRLDSASRLAAAVLRFSSCCCMLATWLCRSADLSSAAFSRFVIPSLSNLHRVHKYTPSLSYWWCVTL